MTQALTAFAEIPENPDFGVRDRRIFRRFVHNHPSAAQKIFELAETRVNSYGSFSANEDERDEQESFIADEVRRAFEDSEPKTYGVISTIIMAVIVKLIVEWITSKI